MNIWGITVESRDSDSEKKELPKKIMTLKINDSGIDESYYERYKAWLEDFLWKITVADIRKAIDELEEKAQNTDVSEYQDLAFDWIGALWLLAQARSFSDLEWFLNKKAWSVRTLDLLTCLQDAELWLPYDIRYATMQLAITVDRLAMYKHWDTVEELNQKRRNKDEKRINAVKEELMSKNVS